MYTLEVVKTQKRITELKKLSTFTWIGMSTDENNLKKIESVLRVNGFDADKEIKMAVISGELMNKYSKLTGTNAYKNDLNILCVLDYYNFSFKIMSGARWLDDIISNNEYVERLKKANQNKMIKKEV